LQKLHFVQGMMQGWCKAKVAKAAQKAGVKRRQEGQKAAEKAAQWAVSTLDGMLPSFTKYDWNLQDHKA